MNVKYVKELNVINDIVISHLKESKQDYLNRKKKLEFKSDIGLSSVMDSPLVHFLRKTNPDIETKTSDHLDTMIGEFMHSEIQRHFIKTKGNNCDIEKPIQIKAKGELGEWTLSGRIDILHHMTENTAHIGDIKVTSSYQVQTLNKELYNFKKTGDWKELKHKYFYQLNAYAEGMRQQGVDIKELYLIIFCKHWSKRLAHQDINFPQYPMYYQKVPILETVQIQEYLTKCVNRHQSAEMGLQEENYLPQCSKDDLWLSDHKNWAVMVKGKKRAFKLFKDKSEAERYSKDIEKSYIENRPIGIPMRCRDYCAYNNVCKQYEKMKEELGVNNE